LTQTLTIENSGTASVTGIPTGTDCTVTEHVHPDFNSTPNGPQAVEVDDDGVAVSFTNTFIPRTGALTISKTTVRGTGTFTFTVDCDGTAFDTTVQITGTGSQTIQGITAGTSCPVTEAPNPNFVVTPTASQTVTIIEGTVTVSFTNTLNNLGCTKTQGYYSTHPRALTPLTIGGVTLNVTQVRNILRSSVGENYLLAVEQQLIAALLNRASGAYAPPQVQAAIDAAQALIQQQGGPLTGTATPQTTVTVNGTRYTASQINDLLASYNEGTFPGGPPLCDD
jgi:Domain of unknown function (DUF5979)